MFPSHPITTINGIVPHPSSKLTLIFTNLKLLDKHVSTLEYPKLLIPMASKRPHDGDGEFSPAMRRRINSNDNDSHDSNATIDAPRDETTPLQPLHPEIPGLDENESEQGSESDSEGSLPLPPRDHGEEEEEDGRSDRTGSEYDSEGDLVITEANLRVHPAIAFAAAAAAAAAAQHHPLPLPAAASPQQPAPPPPRLPPVGFFGPPIPPPGPPLGFPGLNGNDGAAIAPPSPGPATIDPRLNQLLVHDPDTGRYAQNYNEMFPHGDADLLPVPDEYEPSEASVHSARGGVRNGSEGDMEVDEEGNGEGSEYESESERDEGESANGDIQRRDDNSDHDDQDPGQGSGEGGQSVPDADGADQENGDADADDAGVDEEDQNGEYDGDESFVEDETEQEWSDADSADSEYEPTPAELKAIGISDANHVQDNAGPDADNDDDVEDTEPTHSVVTDEEDLYRETIIDETRTGYFVTGGRDENGEVLGPRIVCREDIRARVLRRFEATQ